MSRGIIALLTDFGTTDPYVAAMKGAALSVNPDAQLIDISHHIAPQDVAEAGYVLAASWAYYPAGTVFAAVVDPGVGSGRRILAAEVDGRVLLAPDNGLLTMVLDVSPPTRLVAVTNEAYFRQPVSATFHGRDIFAPVAAHLTLGVPLDDLGPVADGYERLEAAAARLSRLAIDGEVVHVDRFGNLVTSIPAADLGGWEDRLRIHLSADRHLDRLCRTYADVPPGEPLALIGSADLLEISVNGGSAAHLLGLDRRAPIAVELRESPDHRA